MRSEPTWQNQKQRYRAYGIKWRNRRGGGIKHDGMAKKGNVAAVKSIAAKYQA